MDYVLGDRVKGRSMTALDGSIRKTPSWQLVMHYEFKIREKVAKLINEAHLHGDERHDLASALKAARGCRETRDEEFEDKFRLQEDGPRNTNKPRGSRERSPSPPVPNKIPKNKGKGKGNGKGQQKPKNDKKDEPQ